MFKNNKYKIKIIFFGLLFSQTNIVLIASNSINKVDEDRYMFPKFREKTNALINRVIPVSKPVKYENADVNQNTSTQTYSESWHAFKKAQNDEKAMLAREERNTAERDYLVKLYTDVLVPVSKQGYEKAKEFGSYASKEISKKNSCKKRTI